MASEEVKGGFCRYNSCVITDQLATGAGALERELLLKDQTYAKIASGLLSMREPEKQEAKTESANQGKPPS